MTFRLALYGFRGLRLLDEANPGSSQGTVSSPTPGSSTPATSGSNGSTSPGAPSTPASTTPAAPASSGTAPGAAPGATPATPAPAETGFDFNSIFEAPSLEEPVVLPPQPAPTAQPAQPAAPAAPVQTPAAPVALAEPPVAQQAQGPQDPAQQSQRPLFDPADPISIARALKENEVAAIDHVASTVFALRPEELQALEQDVAGMVPKLLAKVLVTAQQQTLSQLGRFMPMMIQRHQEVIQRHTASVNEFYKAWPAIDQTKHDLVVREMGARYRQMNPNATTAQMIKDLGPFVMMRVGIPLTGQALAPQRAAPVAAAVQTPFVPAGPGSVGLNAPAEAGQYDYLGGQ